MVVGAPSGLCNGSLRVSWSAFDQRSACRACHPLHCRSSVMRAQAPQRISTLLDETADADANQPFDALLSLLQTSSERPANLPALASEPLISVLLDNQDESHRRRLDANASIVGLLGALTEADDLLALVSFCRTSDNPEATARYFRQGDFLVNLDPLLAECVSDELVDAVLYLICSLLLTSSGIAYLVLHLESPGSLASWLVSIGEGSEERDILLALESVRLREIITNKAVGRLAVGLVATTAVAAGIDSDDSKGCSAMLQVIATYPAYRPVRAVVRAGSKRRSDPHSSSSTSCPSMLSSLFSSVKLPLVSASRFGDSPPWSLAKLIFILTLLPSHGILKSSLAHLLLPKSESSLRRLWRC